MELLLPKLEVEEEESGRNLEEAEVPHTGGPALPYIVGGQVTS